MVLQMLSRRNGPELGSNERDVSGLGQRGFTLQTLIILAVLMLLAVVAGVVIVAITRSASDDLEDQSQDLEARCAPWEIHSPELEAAGAGGGGEFFETLGLNGVVDPSITEFMEGRGGVTSSKVGCLAPCYIKIAGFLPPGGAANLRFMVTLGDAIDQHFSGDDTDHSVLQFETSNRKPALGEFHVGVTYRRLNLDLNNPSLFNYNTRFKIDLRPSPRGYSVQAQHAPTATGYGWNTDLDTFSTAGIVVLEAVGTHIPPTNVDSSLAIKVTNDQEGCMIYDTETDEIFLDSRLA